MFTNVKLKDYIGLANVHYLKILAALRNDQIIQIQYIDMGFVPSSFIYKQKFQQTYKYETVLLKWKAAAFSTLTVAPDCVFLDILTDE